MINNVFLCLQHKENRELSERISTLEIHSAAEMEKFHVQLKTLQEVEEVARHRGDLVTSLQEELELVRQELEKNKEVKQRYLFVLRMIFFINLFFRQNSILIV